jgi:hypothetical protein
VRTDKVEHCGADDCDLCKYNAQADNQDDYADITAEIIAELEKFLLPPAACATCKRPLNDSTDPMSLDCGGDCWGCVGEAEGEHKDELPNPYLDLCQMIAEIAYDCISADRRADAWPVDDWTHVVIADRIVAALITKGLLR